MNAIISALAPLLGVLIGASLPALLGRRFASKDERLKALVEIHTDFSAWNQAHVKLLNFVYIYFDGKMELSALGNTIDNKEFAAANRGAANMEIKSWAYIPNHAHLIDELRDVYEAAKAIIIEEFHRDEKKSPMIKSQLQNLISKRNDLVGEIERAIFEAARVAGQSRWWS